MEPGGGTAVRPSRKGLDDECPREVHAHVLGGAAPAGRHEDAALVAAAQGQDHVGVEREGAADLRVLPLRHDPVRIPDVAAGQVLEPGERVEAALVLAQLGDPRPHSLRRSGNGDGPVGLKVGAVE